MKTILFADDQRYVREFCKQELEDDGYRVLLARDGPEAISLLLCDPPDLVILDICMPTCDGLEVADRIKRIEPGVPVIFFTSYDEDCLRDPRSRLATACIEKCEDLTELKRAIVRALTQDERLAPLRLGLAP